MKKFKEEGFIVESEITTKNGAWTPIAGKLAEDIRKKFEPVFDKYKEKLSVDAIQMVILQQAHFLSAYRRAMSVDFGNN